jgi:hypothetical protein
MNVATRILVVMSLLASGYLAWALHVIDRTLILRQAYAWGHPCRWIIPLNDHYDAKYPAPRGSVKMHGELPRIRAQIMLAISGTLAVAALAATPSAIRLLRRCMHHRRGFEPRLPGEFKPTASDQRTPRHPAAPS